MIIIIVVSTARAAGASADNRGAHNGFSSANTIFIQSMETCFNDDFASVNAFMLQHDWDLGINDRLKSKVALSY